MSIRCHNIRRAVCSTDVVGVDGCSAGWFAVWGDGGKRWSFDVFPDARSLWHRFRRASLVLIDIPIGLSSKGSRQCDLDARRVLGQPRGSSVFPAPSRVALSASSYLEANANNRHALGVGLSKQCWGICPKIAEIDNLLTKDEVARKVIRESHPEVCFWAFAGKRPMAHRKSVSAGFEERRAILSQQWPDVDRLIDGAEAKYQRKDIARNDILDAVVLYLTAAACAKTRRTLPEEPAKDEVGLLMQMVYSFEEW